MWYEVQQLNTVAEVPVNVLLISLFSPSVVHHKAALCALSLATVLLFHHANPPSGSFPPML